MKGSRRPGTRRELAIREATYGKWHSIHFIVEFHWS